MKKINLISTITIATIATMGVANCGAAGSDALQAQDAGGPVYESSADRLAAGKAQFEAVCASCHGNDGMANTPTGKAVKARNLVGDKYKQGSTVYSIFKTITNGVPGTGMAGGLVADENTRWSVAHYVHSLSKNAAALTDAEKKELVAKYGSAPAAAAAPESKPEIMPYSFDELVKAYKDQGGKIVTRGKQPPTFPSDKQKLAFYRAARQNPAGSAVYTAQCASCHGSAGQGSAFRAMGLNPIITLWTKPIAQSAGYASGAALKKTVNEASATMLKPSLDYMSDSQWNDLSDFLKRLK